MALENLLESFDENKFKCADCEKHFDKNSASIELKYFNYDFDKNLAKFGFKCKKCLEIFQDESLKEILDTYTTKTDIKPLIIWRDYFNRTNMKNE